MIEELLGFAGVSGVFAGFSWLMFFRITELEQTSEKKR